MGVEFVRSCFSGFWRFFANDMGVTTPGYYYFIPNTVPHVGDFHYFGSEDWRKGDDPEIVGAIPPVTLGNDKSLGWDWYEGRGPDLAPPPRTVGNPADFTRVLTFPAHPPVQLLNGIDSRCFPPPIRRLIRNLLFLDLDNCGLLLVLHKILQIVYSLDHAWASDALRLVFGSDVQIDFDDGNADHPAYVIMQSPTNNLFILAGTQSNDLLRRQFIQSFAGPVDFGDIGTMPYWWNHSTRVINFANEKGVDWSKPTFLTGHSFGGATACIIWNRLYEADRTRILRVITWGCPKPGDARLLFNLNTFANAVHVWNLGDIVPAIPPGVDVQAGLQALFPWLPNTWFGTWTPHRRYLLMSPGGNWSYVGTSVVPLDQYILFVIKLLATGQDDPIAAHNSVAYIRRIRDHCPCPELPFTDEVYILLFETIECHVAGIVFGGGDGLFQPNEPIHLELNGHGDLDGDLPAELELDGGGDLPDDLAELELDGGGDLPDDLAELELDGGGDLPDHVAALTLNGSGVLAPPTPGATCSDALNGTLGTVYSYTTTGGTAQWFKWALTGGTLYHLRQTCVNWGNMGNAMDHGTSCSSLSIIFPVPNVFTQCVEYTPSSDENLYFHIFGGLAGDTDYTVVVDVGHC